MKKTELLFLLIPYILYITLSLTGSHWFIFTDKNLLIQLSIVFILIQGLFYFLSQKISLEENFNKIIISNSKIIFYSISFLWLVSGIIYPIRDLRLGDGVLLLENFALESKVYGYQLILDEILEGLIHSRLYASINNIFPNPMDSYKILSSLAGFFLIIILTFFQKNKSNKLSALFIFATGGSLLFYGYSENYTWVSLLIITYVLVGIRVLEEENTGIETLSYFTILASISALFHLVTGYLAFSLVFLCFVMSKKEFIKNAAISLFLALSIILPVFIYFAFFSELRFDRHLAHVTNPRFYPKDRIFLFSHFKEIASCMLLTSIPGIMILIHKFIFERENSKIFISSNTGKFLLLVLGGFLLHGFVHNPQLGFPADWDLMSFYWIPFSLIGFYFIYTNQSSIFKFLPILIFGLSLNFLNAISLNKENISKKNDLELALNAINNFVPNYKKNIDKINKNDRKFHLKTAFFLYKTRIRLEKNTSFESEILLKENRNLQSNFDEKFLISDNNWRKEFLQRATKYHHDYLHLFGEE